ncbi:MAG: flagellar hook assembly protein FlgD [Desulfotomaculales bacterium]
MAVSPITNYFIDTSSQPESVSRNRQELDKNAFLQLLVAQLKYQDPMQAGDPGSFINQLVQFTTLEQLENLQNLVNELTLFAELNQGTALLGKHVCVAGKDGETEEGVVEKVSVNENVVYLQVGGKKYALVDVKEVF